MGLLPKESFLILVVFGVDSILKKLFLQLLQAQNVYFIPSLKNYMLRIIFILSLCFLALGVKATNTERKPANERLDFLMLTADSLGNNLSDSAAVNTVKFKRGKAILFTVFTGFLGGHRIYFGTHHRTPIIYSLTFGGLGILPLIDLVHIVFTKDISIYQNKSQIIMWGK